MITIIDYGAGNLANVKNAVDYLGVEAEITAEPDVVNAAGKIILPGVGAFAPAMERLKESGIATVLRKKVNEGCPLLGICLGMQILFSESEEDGIQGGLNLIPGSVKRFTGDMKIPHMGWNSLEFTRRTSLNEGVTDGSFAYFVHSYYCAPADADVVYAWTEYGVKFAAAVAFNNIFGMQFHPEKSQKAGLMLLKNFGAI